MKTWRVAIAGTGFMGRTHADALRRLPDVQVVALCGRTDPRGRAAALGIPAGYTDYARMLETEKPDAVHICTPNALHHPMALAAVQRGVHVLCEKPFTVTAAQARQLAGAAAENGVVGAVHFHNRFYPMAAQLRQTVLEGQLGEVISVSGGYVQDWMLYPTDANWRTHQSDAGATRVVGDIGSHWLDLAQYVTGQKIVAVLAEFSTVYPARGPAGAEAPVDTEDMAALLCRFENGALGSCFVSAMVAGKKNQLTLTVAGKAGAAAWDGEAVDSLWLGRRDAPNGLLPKDPGLLAPAVAPLSAYPGGHAEGYPDAFKNLFRNFYDTLADRGTPARYATFEEGAQSMAVLEALAESAKTRGWVAVAPPV